jgi:hypothetical protein
MPAPPPIPLQDHEGVNGFDCHERASRSSRFRPVMRQREADFPTRKGEQRKTTTATHKVLQFPARVAAAFAPRRLALAA